MDKQGPLDGFYEYCSKRKMSIFFIFLFTIAVYGLWAFQNYVTFDAEGLYSLEDSEKWYRQWLELGRWSLVLLKRLLGTTAINPYFSIGIFLLCFPLSVLFWGYDLYVWAGEADSRFDLAVFAALYISHPFWASQFAYRNQIEAVTIVMAILPFGVLLITRFLENRHLLSGIIGILLLIFCFGAYQSFIFLYAEAIVLYLFIKMQCPDKITIRKFWTDVLILLIVTALAFAGYEIVTRICQRLNNISGVTDYMSGQFWWGKRPVKDNITVILRYVKRSVLGDGAVINALCGAEGLISLIWFIVSCLKKEKGRILSFLLLALIWCIPFALEVVTAGDIVYRSQFSFIFAVAAMGALLFHWIESLMTKVPSKTIYHGVLLAAVFLAVEPLMQTNTRLLYTDLKTMDEDVTQFRAIYYEAMALGAKEGDAIVLIGGKSNSENDTMLDFEVIGYSYLEENAFYGSDKSIEAMRAMGLNVTKPTDEEIKMAESESASLTAWPQAGSIEVKDDVIIVKLS